MSSDARLSLALLFLMAGPGLPGQEQLIFGGPRIVKLDEGTHGLLSGDFDGDGRSDIAVVNNARARIQLLFHRTSEEAAPPDSHPPEKRNVPLDDPLFEKRSLLTEMRVAGFVSGDFDGDGRDDLVWYGDPPALVVAFQGDGGSFERRKQIDIRDGSQSIYALRAADLEGDGRLDLVLLAERDIIIIRQKEGGLEEPRRIPAVLENIHYLEVADVDGDGRKDLLCVHNEVRRPLRVRLQRQDGTFGPEIALDLPVIRSLAVAYATEGADDLLVVSRASGTLQRIGLDVRSVEREGSDLGTPLHFPFPGASSRLRDVASGDVDGDERPDLVVSDPVGARVLLYRRSETGDLLGPSFFPCYRGAAQVRIADLDGDGRNEVVVMSKDERALGGMSWKDDHLAFPEGLATKGTPLAFDVADLDGDGSAEVVVALKDEAVRLRVIGRGEDAAAPEVPLAGVSDVSAIRIADLDRDGAADLLVLVPYEVVRVLRGGGDRSFTEIPQDVLMKRTSLKDLEPGSATVDDLDGDGTPELIFASRGFARAATVGKDGAISILDQVNGPSGAEIVAACALDIDGDGTREAVLLDRNAKLLRIMRRGPNAVFEEASTVEVGTFEFLGLVAHDVDGDGRKDLIILGQRELAVVLTGGSRIELSHGPAYESLEDAAYLTWIAVGELGGPPGSEIAVIDGNENVLELLTDRDGSWKRLSSWKIYEQKSFERMRRDTAEPHGILLADVTADGIPDVILLVHDRVLVYPGE